MSTLGRLSHFVPPAALRALRRLAPAAFRSPAPASAIRCAGRYPSYAAAQAAAGGGYADARITESVFAKTVALRAALAEQPIDAGPAIERMAATLAAVNPEARPLRVIDFGGAFGTHYWIARRLVSYPLRWCVVETPATCARGAELASDELSFHDSLAAARTAAGPPDLVYTDGTLHALPDPLAALDELVACGAPRLAIRRVATAEALVFTILHLPLSQHEPAGPLPRDIADGSTMIPLACPTRAAIEARLAPRYRINYRFGGASQVNRYDDGITLTMYGYVCELSSGQSRQ